MTKKDIIDSLEGLKDEDEILMVTEIYNSTVVLSLKELKKYPKEGLSWICATPSLIRVNQKIGGNK